MSLQEKETSVIRTEHRVCDGISYTYELILHDNKQMTIFGIPLYSVCVKMREVGEECESCAHTENIFSDLQKASRFFEKLVDSLATPIDLAYIVEDEVMS